MIRKNVASQVIYFPKLGLTVDGTAVTSGATLTVSKDGTEATSAGTLAHSAGGIWKYTPTQGETDCAIMALILTATSADPIVLNCVTTAADTAATAFGAAVAGNQMDLVNSPNATAVTAIQTGLATPTNITAGTITTVTNLTNAPTNGDLTATMKSSVTTAATASTPVVASVSGNVGGNVVGSVGSVAGNIDGSVLGSVESVTSVITLPTMPVGWLTASGLASDAVAEIQSGLATPTNITAATGVVLSGVTHTGAVIPTVSAVTGLTPSNLDVAVSTLATQTSVNTIDDFLDTEVAAIKAKTDQFVFTVAGQVDANALTGGGSGLDAAATRAALGMASANLDTQLGSLATQTSVNTIDDFLDTEVAAIKAKTDQMVFTVANQIDSNVLTGGGSGLDAAETRAALGLSYANLDVQLGEISNLAEGAYDAGNALLVLVADVPTVAEFNARSIVAADYFVVSDYTAPDNSSITSILADTSELQTNQGNWLTATGFSTHSAADAASAVWGAGTRTLTGFGTLVADVVSGVWAAATRTLSAFGFTPSLHADYDAAKTAATQTSVNDLPTNAELATALGTADDAVLAALAALNNLSSAQVSSLLTTLKTDLSTDHGAGAWTTADVSALATSVAVAAVKADTLIAKNAAVPVLGTISNAGTATESYTYGGVTVTYAGLDEDGNRSGVTIT